VGAFAPTFRFSWGWILLPRGAFLSSSTNLNLLAMRLRSASWIQRAPSLLLGCWLAVFTAEPAAMHACPVHDVGQPMSHASHHMPQQQGGNHTHTCTCPGACCPGARAQLATTPVVVSARIVSFVEPELVVARVVTSRDVQLTLPPAIGPPSIIG
jgi:hypothetical protein